MNIAGNIQVHNPLTIAGEIYKLCEPNKDLRGRPTGRAKHKTVFIKPNGDVCVEDVGSHYGKKWASLGLGGGCIGTFTHDATPMNIAYEIIAESALRKAAA